jgi:hypothetical protein
MPNSMTVLHVLRSTELLNTEKFVSIAVHFLRLFCKVLIVLVQCLMCLNDVAGATVNISKTRVLWFAYVNTVKKTCLEVQFLYLGKMEVTGFLRCAA